MNGFSDDFLSFLKSNFPTDYYKAISSDVKPETLTIIYSNHYKHFDVWMRVPSSIRNYYGGRVPIDIMELAYQEKYEELRRIAMNKTLQPESEETTMSSIFTTDKILASVAFAEIFMLGYQKETAFELATNRTLRDYILSKHPDNILTPEEQKEWMLSRQKDHNAIHNDWSSYQPEKMLLHLFSEYNKGKISTDEFMPHAADLMKKIETEGRREYLLAYLKSAPIQAKLSHFKDDILDTLSQTILHEIPQEYRDDYLHHTIPLKIQMRRLIDADNNGNVENIAQQVQQIVAKAKENGVGLDFSNYTADSKHPMSSELRQMFMATCCINNVPYRGIEGERINPNLQYIQNMPEEIQALIASRDMTLAKENMFHKTGNNTNNITLKSLSNEFVMNLQKER